MSTFAQPDVDEGDAPRPPVSSGFTGGEYGDGGDGINTSSLSAILAAQNEQPVEPDVEAAAPTGTPAPPAADDNSGDVTPPDGYVSQDQYDNLQSVLGRQGNELGELRARLAELVAL